MARNLTTRQARSMAKARKTRGAGSGRPRIPTPCPRCGKPCAGYRLAQVHCAR